MHRKKRSERKPISLQLNRYMTRRTIPNRINIYEKCHGLGLSVNNEMNLTRRETINNTSAYQTNIDDTFHKAIGPILTIGQCFGVMPVSGVLSDDASKLKFNWKSWRMLHTVVGISFTGCLTVICFMHMILTGVNLTKSVSLMFFASTCLSLILFLKLAMRWPTLSLAIAQVEYNLSSSSHLYPKTTSTSRWTLKNKFCTCCFVVLFLSLMEHMLSNVAGIFVARECAIGRSMLESFFLYSYPQVFYFFPFKIWICPLLQITNAESTFNWNFMDLFIIVVSEGLTAKFNKLNERLDTTTGKNLPEEFWRVTREEFVALSNLVRQVDDCINDIVLLSFFNNLYFICVQFFNSVKPLRSSTHVIYFTYSFAFLMARFLSVSLFAARIHSASRKPAVAIYAVPSASFCIEVLRFLEQVTKDVVALTGFNFFFVTRGLILTIAGTVITYELVLMQFSSSASGNTTAVDHCKVYFE